MYLISGTKDYLIVFGGCGTPSLDGPHLDNYTLDGRTLPRLFACVRPIRLRQLGHFMMGQVTLLGLQFSLSGALGHDGLQMDWRGFDKGADKSRALTAEEGASLKARILTPVPEEVSAVYQLDDTGHNSPGARGGPALREWAVKNLAILKESRR
jgi:hypothetical protein